MQAILYFRPTTASSFFQRAVSIWRRGTKVKLSGIVHLRCATEVSKIELSTRALSNNNLKTTFYCVLSSKENLKRIILS